MKLLNLLTALVLCAAQAMPGWLGLDLPKLPKGQTLDLGKFTPTWSDEFDGGSLDRETWGLRAFGEYPAPRVDGYWCYETAQVRDGMLHISSVYSGEGLAGGPAGYYTSGLDTSGSFRQAFGYFEVRAMLPKGAGLWSAFWLQSDQVGHVDGSGRDGTEVDVYESFYYTMRWPKRDSVGANLHYDGYGDAHQGQNVGWGYVERPYDTFHTYGVEWNEREYIFYIDGREYGRSSFGGVCQTELYPILSVEHSFNPWFGGDVRDNKPGDMTDFVVDYVRAYQYK
ncbi:MAG: glycoside hydrolase family 16 protein [Oscillospiraceae bacterium]|jgi:beta-glucanase (GH16 family)|nr:glycoside hydrolase family 16 protein [Oscillospiraceae bacterium]